MPRGALPVAGAGPTVGGAATIGAGGAAPAACDAGARCVILNPAASAIATKSPPMTAGTSGNPREMTTGCPIPSSTAAARIVLTLPGGGGAPIGGMLLFDRERNGSDGSDESEGSDGSRGSDCIDARSATSFIPCATAFFRFAPGSGAFSAMKAATPELLVVISHSAIALSRARCMSAAVS